MRQLIPKASYNVGYGGSRFLDLCGIGDPTLASIFGEAFACFPCPIDGTMSNLIGLTTGLVAAPITYTFRKNFADTALTCTVPGLTRTARDVSNVITVNKGDWICVKCIAGAGVGSAFPVGFSIEFNGAAWIFGITPGIGTVGAGSQFVGGAFGNGVISAFAPTQYSNTLSIDAIEGSIVGLLLRQAGSPTGGGWRAQARVQKVLQDGSGGTPDSTAVLTDGDSYGESTFDVPVIPPNKCEVFLERTGTTAPFSTQCGVGIAFLPTVEGLFMFCGGSNDATTQTTTEYKWVRSQQQNTDQKTAEVPMGPANVLLKGIYTETTGSPGAGGSGNSLTTNVLLDGVPTAISAVQFETATSALSFADVIAVDGTFCTLQLVKVGTTTLGEFHWGLAAEILAETATLTVQKTVIGDDAGQLFTINVGGGVLPASVDLANGGSQVYSDVTPGSGFSVSEPSVPAGFVLGGISISNGQPASNFSIAPGESVVATVTNIAAEPPPPPPGPGGSCPIGTSDCEPERGSARIGV